MNLADDRLNRASLLEAAFQQSPFGIVVAIAPDGDLALVSEQMAQIWRRSDVITTNISDYGRYDGFHPDGRRYTAEEWPISRALQHGEIVTDQEIRILRGDGTTGYLRVSAQPIKDQNGMVIASVSITMDVTERVEAELSLATANIILTEQAEELEVQAEELRTQNEESLSFNQQLLEIDSLNRALNDINLLANSTHDPDDVMRQALARASNAIHCDNAAISLRKSGRWIVSYVFGFSEDIIGVEMDDREEIHAMLAMDTRSPVMVNDAYTDNRVNHLHMKKWGIRSVLVVPIIIRQAPAGVIFFNYQKNPFHFQNHHADFATKLAAIVSLALDNAQLFQDLMREIEDRRAAEQTLREYTGILKASNEELERFAFTASHDLQAPLRRIEMFGDLIKKSQESSLGENERVYLERIQAATKRMRLLIDDLLILARVTYATSPYREVNLNEIARQVISDLQVLIHQTGGMVTVSDLPTIEADPTQMRQLLQNLIDNGLKFHSPGVHPVVSVTSEQAEGYCVKILVTDNGVGMDSSDIEQIFLPFTRMHKGQGYEGTGIGLSICEKIAARHHGSIVAQSTPGQGTTIIVTLPLSQKTN